MTMCSIPQAQETVVARKSRSETLLGRSPNVDLPGRVKRRLVCVLQKQRNHSQVVCRQAGGTLLGHGEEETVRNNREPHLQRKNHLRPGTGTHVLANTRGPHHDREHLMPHAN